MGKRGLVAFLSLKPCFYVSVFVCLHPGVGHEKWQSFTVYYSKRMFGTLDWLQSLKYFFINVSYHILVASLTLKAGVANNCKFGVVDEFKHFLSFKRCRKSIMFGIILMFLDLLEFKLCTHTFY